MCWGGAAAITAVRPYRRNHLKAHTSDRVLAEQVVGERTAVIAVANDVGELRHRVDHDVIADPQAGDIGTDFEDLPGRLVAERGMSLPRRDTADGDVEAVGSTDTTGAHPDQHIGRAGVRARVPDDFDGAGAGHDRCQHV
jgi:hypothetical protein